MLSRVKFRQCHGHDHESLNEAVKHLGKSFGDLLDLPRTLFAQNILQAVRTVVHEYICLDSDNEVETHHGFQTDGVEGKVVQGREQKRAMIDILAEDKSVGFSIYAFCYRVA